jgi:hypothetical protein
MVCVIAKIDSANALIGFGLTESAVFGCGAAESLRRHAFPASHAAFGKHSQPKVAPLLLHDTLAHDASDVYPKQKGEVTQAADYGSDNANQAAE